MEERLRLFRERNEARKKANAGSIDSIIESIEQEESMKEKKRWEEHWASLPIQRNVALEDGR